MDESTPQPPAEPGAAPPQNHAQPDVTPMQVDSRRVVLIGTGVWVLALIVLLPFWDWLGRNDHRVWQWTCVAGIALGLVGSLLVRRHRAEGRTN